MLYDPGSHERLEGERWSESRAQEAIRTIVADAEAALPDGSFWPIHPADGDSSGVETTIYLGAAGVLWALDTLQSAGGVELRRPYGPVALQALDTLQS
ncbi:MAG: lanthionine synthetase C family protein, partial [Gaiellaceae bacterium]